jgi:hypothetical protein
MHCYATVFLYQLNCCSALNMVRKCIFVEMAYVHVTFGHAYSNKTVYQRAFPGNQIPDKNVLYTDQHRRERSTFACDAAQVIRKKQSNAWMVAHSTAERK